MLISDPVRSIVNKIEGDSTLSVESLNSNLRELVTQLDRACQTPEAQERYRAIATAPGEIRPYPIEADGYAKSFDPLVDEAGFMKSWETYGVVVGKQVAKAELCRKTADRIHEITKALSQGTCNLADPTTFNNIPRDAQGAPLLSRGFFEVYHDDSLAQIRQLARLYVHHVLLWGDAKLWTSFDRLGVKLPRHEESKSLPLHVDQNPNVHAGLKTTQGVLAISDCPEDRGTFVAVPGSKRLFENYARMAVGKGEYVELKADDPLASTLQAHMQALPLRSGDFVSWDSRTTHSNTSNRSDLTRIVAYVSQGPVPANEDDMRIPRLEALESGLGSNVREALMHASRKPRFTQQEAVNQVRTPEELHLLGKLLYGTTSYREIL